MANANGTLPTAPGNFFLKHISEPFEAYCCAMAADPSDGIRNESVLAKKVTDAYIKAYADAGYALPETEQIVSEWTLLADVARKTLNRQLEAGSKITRFKYMPAYVIARFLFLKKEYALINLVGEERDKTEKMGQPRPILCKYQERTGLWRECSMHNDESDFTMDCTEYSTLLKAGEVKQVFTMLVALCKCDDSKKRTRTIDKNLSAFNNGIFNWKTHELLPFSSDYVFLSKCPINLKKNVPEVHITEPDGSDWTFDKWMDSISTNAEMKYALYALIQATLRPYNDWRKIFFFVNSVGRNGKGTFGEVLKQIAPQAESLSFASLGEKFLPKSLIYTTLIISDENDAGDNERAKSERKAKALATHDCIDIECKGVDKITARPYLIQVHMYNSVPRMCDTTQSMLERLYMFKFEKSFRGVEKVYIKDQYLKRDDVLEWIVSYVAYTMPTLDKMPPLADSAELIQDVKEENNPVEAFLADFDYNFDWNFVPMSALYQIYTLWYRGTHAGNRAKMGDKTFAKVIKQIAAVRGDMEYKKDRPSNSAYNTAKMTCPVLREYRNRYNADYTAGKLPLIDDWMPDGYKTKKDWVNKCKSPVYGIYFIDVNSDVPENYDIDNIWTKIETPTPEAYNRANVGMTEQKQAS